MAKLSETGETCPNCGGHGWRFMAPPGVNTFRCRIEMLERILKRKTCWECHGTGNLPAARAVEEGGDHD